MAFLMSLGEWAYVVVICSAAFTLALWDKLRSKKWRIILIVLFILTPLALVAVSVSAANAVVREGDEFYQYVLMECAEAYSEMERLAQGVLEGRVTLGDYSIKTAPLHRTLLKHERFIQEREYRHDTSRFELADFYREVFDWGLFPD